MIQQTDINNKNNKIKKEINKEKAISFFPPNKNEVIDFFMSRKELKPSEAESQAESFYAHFSEIDKSISFDWREETKIWQSKISPFKGEKNTMLVNAHRNGKSLKNRK